MASHLSMEERKRILDLREAGYSPQDIADAVGRHWTTISRELARNRLKCRNCPRLAQ